MSLTQGLWYKEIVAYMKFKKGIILQSIILCFFVTLFILSMLYIMPQFGKYYTGSSLPMDEEICGIEACFIFNYQKFSEWADSQYGKDSWILQELPYCDKDSRFILYQGVFYKKNTYYLLDWDICKAYRIYGAKSK